MQYAIVGRILLVVWIVSTLTVTVSAKDWWENGNFYQIYPRSFKDSNGDGIGDLNGITSKIPYLKEIGIDGVWLSPIFKSPMVDFGYDISDFLAIQPEYGTMEDFERLANVCRAYGIRLILDFVPNHSSDQHEWFKKSVKREKGYENYYIWHPGKVNNVTGVRSTPNNWNSVFRFSAWAWNDVRKEYYLHQFTPEQPDLNYRDAGVVTNMKNTLSFWLKKGVSGFRVDTIPNLFEIAADKSGNYPDEPKSGNCIDPQSHCYLSHIYTTDQNETYDMAYQWHELLEAHKKANGGDTPILMTEAYTSLQNIHRYYGDGKRNGSQIPFNFYFLTNVDANTNALRYKNLIDDWLKSMPSGVQANWVLGNHDQKRLGSRLGEARRDLHNILLKTLPGVSITYQGEEIGMTDVFISWKETVDPQACNTNETVYHANSRDPARSPFQWDDSEQAGFTTGKKTWLPVNVNYKCINVQTERTSPKSHLNVYKRLVQIRRDASFVNGTYVSDVLAGDIFAYKRQAPTSQPYVIVLNLGKEWKTVDVRTKFNVPQQLKVVTASIQSQYSEGDVVNATRLTIPNDVGIVLTTL